MSWFVVFVFVVNYGSLVVDGIGNMFKDVFEDVDYFVNCFRVYVGGCCYWCWFDLF